jgi:hypothetical protein
MAYGLQVWGSGGDIVLDTTYRISRIVHEQFCTIPANSTLSVSVPGIQPFSNWAVQCQAYSSYLAPPQLLIISLEIQTDVVLIKTFNSNLPLTAKLIVYRM